jgi:putative ABC transport system permease protein
MLSLLQDLRYGLRGLRANPGFSALAIATLALGIGAATTMFSVVKNVMLSPFPYKDAGQIAAFAIHDLDSANPGGRNYFSASEYLAFRHSNHVFAEDIGADMADVLWTTPEGSEQFVGAYVTPNTFQFLGVPALLGRVLTAEDGKPGAPAAFVLSYKVWVSRFHQDPSILNHTFTLDGKPYTLVGIMPKRFTKRGADLWIATDISPTDERGYLFQARLKPGVTLKQVEADLLPIAQSWAKEHPKDYPKHFKIEASNYVDSVIGSFKKTLLTLGAAVALLLLIACANVANMLLAKSTARDREMAIRSALGASRWRVTRQLLVESLLIGVGGAALGAALAWGGITALVHFIPESAIPREAEITLDPQVLVFSLALAVVTSLLFGLAPAWQLTRLNIVEPLKDSGRGISGGFRRARLRNTLVVVELALSMVLLSGAGLMIRTFASLTNQDLGFNPHNILVARLPFAQGHYTTAAEKQRFFSELLPRLKGIPGLIDVTTASALPPYGGIRTPIDVPGKTHNDQWSTIYQLVSEGYLRTMGISMARGRFLDEVDVAGARRMAVINQTAAAKFFGSEDPIGRQITFAELGRGAGLTTAQFEVIGVFRDMKNDDINQPVRPETLIPYTVTSSFSRGIMARTAGNPMSLLRQVQNEIWAVDRGVATTMTRSLDEFMADFTFSQPRFVLIVLVIFAGLGLLLVAAGVYSVIAYTVSRQTREIGIRMALGAARGDVVRMVLRMGLWLIAAGLTIGLCSSLLVNRVLASQLFGVTARDPLTFAAVSCVVILVGLAACWFPARRATKVDPVEALRFE